MANPKPLIAAPGRPLSLHRNAATRSRQFNGLVQNILTAHHDMSSKVPALVSEGYNWYDRAQEIADKLGKGNLQMGAGVIAAMSPQKNWDVNLRLAHDMFNKGKAGHYGVQVTKARRILEGENPEDVLGQLKEGNFYKNIVNPDDPSAVTIDRHANDVAINQKMGQANRGLSSEGRYNIFHSAYTTAAGHLGIETPSRLQASVWTPVEQGLWTPGKDV